LAWHCVTQHCLLLSNIKKGEKSMKPDADNIAEVFQQKIAKTMWNKHTASRQALCARPFFVNFPFSHRPWLAYV
jgi:hypothetical protein